ncbi:hypothetical protein PI125_g13560 [Phytophthora idaei]|nr:hypothetical protein PI125_g13560 [Phytophthora idaei]KAG3147975.1 hypothetical protein PI126_g12647 [Phytophthora idaei]
MMEATVVGTLALHMANQLTAELQLRYPALKLAEDLIGVLVCCTSSSLAARITKAKERRTSFEEDGTFKFVPGTLLHDFTNVWITLSINTSVFPPIEEAHIICFPDGYFGPKYGEKRTPEYVLPDVNHYVVLLTEQIPMLYTVSFDIMVASVGESKSWLNFDVIDPNTREFALVLPRIVDRVGGVDL